MIQAETLHFLRDLSENNNRDWFQDNRKRYDTARKDFEKTICKEQIRYNGIDPIPVRELRRRKLKEVYKTETSCF